MKFKFLSKQVCLVTALLQKAADSVESGLFDQEGIFGS